MPKIISNQKLTEEFFLLTARCDNRALAGQFYMLRAWDDYPMLSRPVSVFDRSDNEVSFLCKKVGKGTELLSRILPGDELSLLGPLGSSFSGATGALAASIPGSSPKVALVGGGVGIAPLHLAAKQFRLTDPTAVLDIYLGFSDEVILADVYEKAADELIVNVGGFITDEIDPAGYDYILSCGPEIMMKVLYNKCVSVGKGASLWVSMESRMACGIGACLVCSCKTAMGNRKICKDGPVFKADILW
ncbi:dihydroorotate dehydrogenase [Clostridia bacterium]|nr:dihydroorotate dehydrogenase [Clostridia bacterium]